MRADEIGASRCGHVREPRRCVEVTQVCFEAEQLLLHAPDAPTQLTRLLRVLNGTRDPSDVFALLRPVERPTALVARPGVPYSYLPLATGVKRVRRIRNRILRTHTPRAREPAEFVDDVRAIAFFTSWSNSFTEIFSRAVVRVFELWCAHRADRDSLHLIPAMWGSDWGPDYSTTWLAPFTAHRVQPLARTPPRALVKPVWRGYASPNDYARYTNLSVDMFRARAPPRCFARALVCDFTSMPKESRPWATSQAIAAHHMTTAAAKAARRAVEAAAPEAHAPAATAGLLAADGSAAASRRTVRIVFALRRGRRKLANVDELIGACNGWNPANSADAPPSAAAAAAALDAAAATVAEGREPAVPGPSALRRAPVVNCSGHNFGVGLAPSLPLLRSTDILVMPHGADLINGFSMRRGASVIELMPVHQRGCPCDMYRKMYAHEGAGPPSVLHYQLHSSNASYAVSKEAYKARTYNSDLFVPWRALEPVLAHVLMQQRLQRWRHAVDGHARRSGLARGASNPEQTTNPARAAGRSATAPHRLHHLYGYKFRRFHFD